MENSSKIFAGAIFHWALVGILLPLACAENFTEPRYNVNISPFQQWRSAAECIMNVSQACSIQNKLTLNGTIDVLQAEVEDYCTQGCSQHTLDVLTCIHYVKRDFWFANKAHVWTLQNLITDGCSTRTAISTANLTSSAMRASKMTVLPFISCIVTLASLAMFAYH